MLALPSPDLVTTEDGRSAVDRMVHSLIKGCDHSGTGTLHYPYPHRSMPMSGCMASKVRVLITLVGSGLTDRICDSPPIVCDTIAGVPGSVGDERGASLAGGQQSPLRIGSLV